jgi:hypothetical protein
MHKNPLLITASVAALIAVAAAATLFVVSAYAGQKSGLRHCPPRVERLAWCWS